MSRIYVTGHRNPDTDSIVAAIAYSNLRNALGEREYQAVRIGEINDETQRLLDLFQVNAPPLLQTMRTQVRDLEYDQTPALNHTVTMNLAWKTMRDGSINAVPIVDDDGKLCGMLSAGDLASFDMQTTSENRIDHLPIFNMLSVLEGKLVNEARIDRDTVSGELFITLPQNYPDPALTSQDTILICGNQPDLVEQAIRAGVNCLILCRADIRSEWEEAPGTSCVVSTPLSARRVSRLLYQAQPVEKIGQGDNIVSFHLNDYIDDVRETMLRSRYRSYPILDDNDQVVGTLSRFHLLRPRRKRVVLVDHNEAAQSVPGLEQADILAIIDHHRLADIQTGQPIYVRNEPVGSTNTIIMAMYQENGVTPPPKIAGLMAGAILSDTVYFRSPTCTPKDVMVANRLARIAGVSLDEVSEVLFASEDTDSRTVQDLFCADYKQFHIADHNIGVSQITCTDSKKLLARKQEFLDLMEWIKADKHYDMVFLMLTDVLMEGTYLLYAGDDNVIREAFRTEPMEQELFLKNMMSRKKQMIPTLTALWG